MKRAKVLLIASLALTTAVEARAANSHGGFKAGVSLQEFGGDDAKSLGMESRAQFVGGGYIETELTRNLGFRLELLYFNKGASLVADSIDVSVKLAYVEVPLLLMAHFPASETIRVSAFGGPTLAANTSADAEVSYQAIGGTVDVAEAFESFEVGLTFGVGIGFDFDGLNLGLDARYGFSLDTIADEGFDNYFGIVNADVKNQGFAFMASIGWPFGSE